MIFGSAKRRANTIEKLRATSQVVETTMGPVEFTRRGRAPYVLLVHGTPAALDQSSFGEPLEAAGFGTIAPSRPGYLRTPLETGPTFEEQGDAMAALLDVLEIDRDPKGNTRFGTQLELPRFVERASLSLPRTMDESARTRQLGGGHRPPGFPCSSKRIPARGMAAHAARLRFAQARGTDGLNIGLASHGCSLRARGPHR